MDPADLSALERDSFLVAEDLAHRGEAVTPATLGEALRRYFGYQGSGVRQPLSQLVGAGLLRRRSMQPSRRGRRLLESAVETYFSERGLVESAESSAFRALRRARQGFELCQHGTLTAGQLQAISASAAGIRAGGNGGTRESGQPPVLDLGCGTGEIGRHVAGLVGGRLLGIDRSRTAVEYARRRARSEGVPEDTSVFRCERIEEAVARMAGGNERGSIALILAVDALYWVEELEELIEELVSLLRPGGRLLVVSSEFEEQPGGARTVPWEHSDVGAALTAAAEREGRLRLSAVDFTAEERRIWLDTPQLCAGREESFAAEGREYLLRNLLREAEDLERAMRRGRGSRYLSVAECDASSPISRR
jgi:SAM-dependent methyltransferase